MGSEQTRLESAVRPWHDAGNLLGDLFDRTNAFCLPNIAPGIPDPRKILLSASMRHAQLTRTMSTWKALLISQTGSEEDRAYLESIVKLSLVGIGADVNC